MENDQEFAVKNCDNCLPRSKALHIFNSMNNYLNPESYIEQKEDVLDFYFGKNKGVPSDFLQFENSKGEVVGMAGLFNFRGNAKTWRVLFAFYPKYLSTSLPQMIIDSSILLAENSDKSKVYLSTTGLENRLDQALKHREKSPFHYQWSLKLVHFNQPERSKILDGITVQFCEGINDYEGYTSVLNQAFQNHFEFKPILADEYEQLSQLEASYITSRHYFAFDNDKLVGFCNMAVDKEKQQTGNIAGLGILPDYQNRGIGSVLLEKGIEFLQSTEVSKIVIGVDGENPKAIELYKKFGFQVEDKLTQKFYQMK